MARRRSSEIVKKEREEAAALAEFRRTPRIVGVLFSHDDIDGIFALRVSHNEEPHTVFMCTDRQQCEFIKAWQRDTSLWDFEDAFRQHESTLSPWGRSRRALDDYTPDYFDSYAPEMRGDPGLEFLPF